MSVEERDNYTGYLTTGHDWNGIKELNTHVPWVLLFFLAATFLFSVGYWYFLPAWPGVNDYTRGKLGIDQRDEIEEQLAQADALKSSWSSRLQELPFEKIVADDELMQVVAEGGQSLYKDNCAMCHGQHGEGAVYFPRLTDESWLWGGSPEAILKTLQVGINAGVPGTRATLMQGFGKLDVLDSQAISDVSFYVQSLSNQQLADGSNANNLLRHKQGKAVFDTNCVACHGANGGGNIALGAPNLRDDYWIYGADDATLRETITNGRMGHMPAWQDRLTDVELRILALYVAQLSETR